MENPTSPVTAPRDFNKSSKTLALEQIYASTNFKSPVGKIVFGLPEVLDPRLDLDNDEDTFVPAILDNVYDARFSTNGGFRYKRLNLSELFRGTLPTLTVPEAPFRAHSMLAKLNEAYGAQLSIDDVLDLETTEDGTFLVVANPLSLAWVGYAELVTQTVDPVPANARMLEDGSLRHTEDGEIRTLEGV